MHRLATILCLLPALVLFVLSEEVCDGKTATMGLYNYAKPLRFNNINLTGVSKEECSKACLDDDECASAYFSMFNCSFVAYESTTMKMGVPGFLYVKMIKDAEICSMNFMEIGSNAIPMAIPGDDRKIFYSANSEFLNVIVA